MILIPELEKVLILTPRAGSTSLKKAVLDTYPRAILLYRHMEADGVPQGYDSWEKVGVVRHPVDRLWSLFKLLKKGYSSGRYGDAWEKKQNKSVDNIGFSD